MFYLRRWDGNPNLPHGLIYEGVSETPLKVSGVDLILMKHVRMQFYGETVKLILRLLI